MLNEKNSVLRMALAVGVMYFIGMFIYRIRLMHYFPNITHVSADFTIYLLTALLWGALLVLTLFSVYWIEKRHALLKIIRLKWKRVWNWSWRLFVFVICIDFVGGLLYGYPFGGISIVFLIALFLFYIGLFVAKKIEGNT